MHIFRALCFGIVLAGLGCVALTSLPGCGEESTAPGTTVKVDQKEVDDRAKKIGDMYRANPPKKSSEAATPAPK